MWAAIILYAVMTGLTFIAGLMVFDTSRDGEARVGATMMLNCWAWPLLLAWGLRHVLGKARETLERG